MSGSTSGLSPAGIFVGDSSNVSSLIRLNTVVGNSIGIHVRDSAHGTVTENTATGNCVGIELQDTGFDPIPTFDWTLVHNRTDNNTVGCTGPVPGIGLVVGGATHSRLTANEASGNVVGLVVVTGSGIGGADPSYLQIDNNQLVNNRLTDLYYDGSGTAVTFAHNTCTGGPCPQPALHLTLSGSGSADVTQEFGAFRSVGLLAVGGQVNPGGATSGSLTFDLTSMGFGVVGPPAPNSFVVQLAGGTITGHTTSFGTTCVANCAFPPPPGFTNDVTATVAVDSATGQFAGFTTGSLTVHYLATLPGWPPPVTETITGVTITGTLTP